MIPLRLGGPLFARYSGPEQWLAALRAKGYTAAYAPIPADSPDPLTAEYAQAARENDILIAEVGAWLLHPLQEDRARARADLEQTARILAFADRLGARCCVNVASSRGPRWDGADPRDRSEETFAMVVESVREILRLAAPRQACYGLEMMPWMFPTGLEDMQRLLAAVDHPRFAVHYDPCNTVNTVERYFANGEMMETFVETLGPRILSIHCKDLVLHDHLTVRFEERCPGEGALDHGRLLSAVARVNPAIPIMLEHLPDEAAYDRAAAHLRRTAASVGVELSGTV